MGSDENSPDAIAFLSVAYADYDRVGSALQKLIGEDRRATVYSWCRAAQRVGLVEAFHYVRYIRAMQLEKMPPDDDTEKAALLDKIDGMLHAAAAAPEMNATPGDEQAEAISIEKRIEHAHSAAAQLVQWIESMGQDLGKKPGGKEIEKAVWAARSGNNWLRAALEAIEEGATKRVDVSVIAMVYSEYSDNANDIKRKRE